MVKTYSCPALFYEITRVIIILTGAGSIAGILMAGATVIDYLSHGNIFHATGASVKMKSKDRIKLVPFESLVGLTMTIVATILYGFLK